MAKFVNLFTYLDIADACVLCNRSRSRWKIFCVLCFECSPWFSLQSENSGQSSRIAFGANLKPCLTGKFFPLPSFALSCYLDQTKCMRFVPTWSLSLAFGLKGSLEFEICEIASNEFPTAMRVWLILVVDYKCNGSFRILFILFVQDKLKKDETDSRASDSEKITCCCASDKSPDPSLGSP